MKDRKWRLLLDPDEMTVEEQEMRAVELLAQAVLRIARRARAVAEEQKEGKNSKPDK